jgi:hypothetical protein
MALRLCVHRECIGYVRIEGSPRLARRERRAEGKHIVLRTQEIAHPNSKKKHHGSKEKRVFTLQALKRYEHCVKQD